ncbi:MAG: DUF1800 family protein [Gemmatimonadetes bacterium]|nr:DUF1800 family protein [Gemmatimonadota bacterium]
MAQPPDHDIEPSADADPSATPSRRSLLAMGVAAAAAPLAAAALPRTVAAQPPRRRGSTPFPSGPGNAGRLDPAAEWRDPLLRLVRRITMGMSPEEVALARRLGYTGYLNHHLNAAAIDDGAVEALVAERLPMTGWTPTALATANQTDQAELGNQLADASWYRAAFSRAQLRERMVEFWTDHFTVSINKVGYLKLVDDRDVIRPNALGTFPALLRATAHSGAMLVYLDQNRSSTPVPNQNYAREIMELHTLGADGGYSQTDVAELSRILTGWSTTGPGTFFFNRNVHDRNAKTFLGRSFPAMAATAATDAMKAEGDTAIQMLLDHPSTARYVSWKMARWLLAYEPPETVVAASAAAYASTGGSIPAMIRAILSSANLMAAPAKYKRPFHLAVSAIRALGMNQVTVPNIRGVRATADAMGMPLFRWEQPNGYPDYVDWWSGLVMTRWSYVQYLASLASTTVARLDTMLFRTPDTADGVVAQVAARLFGGEMPLTLRAQLQGYLRGGTYSDTRVREALALALSSQEFQWY